MINRENSRAELLSLSADNAKVVARHLVCVGLFIHSDPNRAHLHGMLSEKGEEIEMRIVASGARRDVREMDAAVITLICKELKNETAEWSVRLRYAYADALNAAGRLTEAREWFTKCAEFDRDEVTDALEMASLQGHVTPGQDLPSLNT